MSIAPVPALPPAAGPSSSSSSGADGGEFGLCLAEHVGSQARATGSGGDRPGQSQEDTGADSGTADTDTDTETGTPVPQGLAALLGLVHGASAAAAVSTLATVARGRGGPAEAAGSPAAGPAGSGTSASDGTTPQMVRAAAGAGVPTLPGDGETETDLLTALAPAGKKALVAGPVAPDQQAPDPATDDGAPEGDGEPLAGAAEDTGPGPKAPPVAGLPSADAGQTGQTGADTPNATPVAAASAAPATPAAGASSAPAAPQPATNPLLDQVTPVVSRMVSAGEGSHRMVLRLHPADLGEVHLTVTVRGEHVDVTVAAGAEARGVLSGGSSELRGLLDSLGRTAGQITFRDLPSGAHVPPAPSAASTGQQQPGQQQPGQPGTSLGDSGGARHGQRGTGHGGTSHAGAGARTDQQQAEPPTSRTIAGRSALDVRI